MIVSGRKVGMNLSSSLLFFLFIALSLGNCEERNSRWTARGNYRKGGKNYIGIGGDILRKLLLSTRTLRTMPGYMVRKMLSFDQRREVCDN